MLLQACVKDLAGVGGGQSVGMVKSKKPCCFVEFEGGQDLFCPPVVAEHCATWPSAAARMITYIRSNSLVASPAEAATITARSLLFKLSQKVEAGSSSYARSKFSHWTDADRDCCDTREEVLIKESKVRVRRGAGCKIFSGKWVSWYDGRTGSKPSDVDIDHVVALKKEWSPRPASASSSPTTSPSAGPWTR